MSAPETLPLGTVIDRRYRVESLLGAGGMGAVFAATDTGTGTRLALKVLDPDSLSALGGDDRFRREADLAQRVTHPNLVRVLGHGCDAVGTRYIAFELLDGRSLRDEIRRVGPMPAWRAGAIALEVLAALQAAHAAAIVHRDLKPENVFLLRANDQVKVLDFGIAKSTKPGTAAGLTQDGIRLGTPAYMAPEQFAQADVGPQADLFALGIVLLEMLVGQLPFQTGMPLVYDRLSGVPIPIPPSIAGQPMAAVIARATQTDPAHRYATAAEMAAAVRAAVDASGARIATGNPMTRDQMYAATQANMLAATQSHVLSRTQDDVRVPIVAAPAAVPAMGPMAQPYAQPTPFGYGGYTPVAQPAPPPSPRRSMTPLVVLGVVALLLVAGVAGFLGFRLTASVETDDRDRARRGEGRRREPPPPPPELPPIVIPTVRPGTVVPLPPIEPEPEPPPPLPSVRTAECGNAESISNAEVERELAALGWQKTGTMTYCAESMVNFRCVGPGGEGITVTGPGGREGSVVPIRFASPAAARAYVDSGDELTLAAGGKTVLRVELPAAEADKLLARVCLR
jgi:hypothetical protein